MALLDDLRNVTRKFDHESKEDMLEYIGELEKAIEEAFYDIQRKVDDAAEAINDIW